MGATPLDTAAASERSTGIATGLASFALLTLFYILTAPTNHSLAIDAHSYAEMITRDNPLSFVQTRELLWLAVMQGLYHATALVVPSPDPFAIAAVFNAALTALAVLLFRRILIADLRVAAAPATYAAALFATAFGIWRYATEVEVYAMAAMLSLLLLHALLSLDRPGAGRRDLVLLGLLGGVATLAYQPLGLISVFVVTFHMLMRRRLVDLILYGLISGSIVLGGFAAAWMISGDGLNFHDFLFDPNEVSTIRPDWTAVPKILYAVGHDILGSYWTFAYGPLRDILMRMGPSHFFDEEIYVATHAGWTIWLPLVTFPAALVLLAMIVRNAVRRGLQPRFSGAEATVLAWLAVHTAMMTMMSPEGAEGWILGTVPLFLIIGLRLVAPCVAAGHGMLVALLFGVFLIHNGVSELGMEMGQRGDYVRNRGDAILSHVGAGDLVVVATDWTVYKYLLLYGKADLLQVPRDTAETAAKTISDALARGERVFVTDTFLHPPASLHHAAPEVADGIEELAKKYGPGATKIELGDTGALYLLGSAS